MTKRRQKQKDKASVVARWWQRLYLWRESLSLSAYLKIVVVGSILGASISASLYALYLQYRSAAESASAIIYLEGERLANFLGAELLSMTRERPAGSGNYDARQPDAVLEVASETRLVPIGSRFPFKTANAADIGQRRLNFDRPATVVSLPEGVFVLRVASAAAVKRLSGQPADPARTYMAAWRLDFAKLVGAYTRRIGRHDLLYYVNRDGQLVYASSDLNEDALRSRPLVQGFISGKLATAALEYNGIAGESRYGFYAEVPNTNLVMFTEVARISVITSVLSNLKLFVLVLAAILILTLFLLRAPIAAIIRPIRELTVMAGHVTRGDFSVMPTRSGYGELATFMRAFGTMTAHLRARDRAIVDLLGERRDRVRMSQELEVAKGLQENFLPRRSLPPESGLMLFSSYLPAAYVAGDWFTYDFNPNTGETVIVIADVTGHDVAASMFTAMIAGLFNELRSKGQTPFPLEKLRESLHRSVAHFGADKWGATVQAIRFQRGSRKVSIMNCGHVFPALLTRKVSKRGKLEPKVNFVRLPSAPLGYGAHTEAVIQELELGKDETLFLYSDGVTETRRPDGNIFGNRRFAKLLESLASKPLEGMVAGVLKECAIYRGPQEPADDICLVALRIAG